MPRTPKAKPSQSLSDTAASDSDTKPSIDDTKPYSKPRANTTSPSKPRKWTKEDKIAITLAVITAGTKGQPLDWDTIASMFEGKTRSQTYDQWRWVFAEWRRKNAAVGSLTNRMLHGRQHILPSIKKTGSVGGEQG